VVIVTPTPGYALTDEPSPKGPPTTKVMSK